MAFDGIVTFAMARELAAALTDGKIEKIYQPERHELVFVVRCFKARYKLYMSCAGDGCGVYLSEEDYQNPATPSGLVMLLRKRLSGGIIRDISQRGCERIIELTVETYDELGELAAYRVVCEIMGKHSNIVIVDQEGIILDSVKRLSPDQNRARQILPGLAYTAPPAQHKIPFDMADPAALASLWQEEAFQGPVKEPFKTILDSVQGLSPILAEEVAARAGFSPDGRLDPDRVSGVLREMTEQLSAGDTVPTVYLKEDGSPRDFHVLPIAAYEEALETLRFDTVSEAAAYYFSHRQSSNRIRQKSQELERHLQGRLKKLYLKKQRLSEDLLEAENSEKYRLYGELLTANLHACKTGDKEVTVVNYYDNQPLTIPLDVRYAPAKNAQIYFKKYSKAKNAVREKQGQIEACDRDIEYLESTLDSIGRAERAEDLDDIRQELVDTGFLRPRKVKGRTSKKENFAPYRYETSSGLVILAGRNNKENDHITLKVAGKNDLWFHTKDIPGSHVILFCKNKTPDDKAVYEAARVAAWHSKGRGSENVPVDYTKVRYVKKPNGAKPGMVIFTDNHTVYVTPGLPER